MTVHLYKHPQDAGWLGWIDGENERCVGFIALDGAVQFGW